MARFPSQNSPTDFSEEAKKLVVVRDLCVAAVRCRIIVGALAITMVCAVAPAAADEVQRKRFLEEAPKAWAALEDYISRSRSVVHETVTLRTPDRDDGSAPEQVMHCTIETKLAGEKLVVIRQQAPDWPVPGPRVAIGRVCEAERAVFAPDRYWTLDKATAHIAYGDGETPMSYSFQYKIDSAGFPLLSRVEVSYDREPGSRETTVREYSTFDHIDIPDDEFLLTAFGLPEPTPVAGRAGGWRWGLIAAGVAALLIAATLRRLVRKREQVI